MLKLKNIKKVYGDDKKEGIVALKGIDIEFRNNEFVSILGQSGCGKTTLLNIIGGLDRYTDGDLIINNKSTKDFTDRDWDSYRNYSVGFVFQSYNLIPHQSVLANVELALTISGYSATEKKSKAIEALKSVGLEDQIYKKPNELSGGQMQRVAIARAIVNNPDIILADEPTGALDTKTSTQIMELLKSISKDKLIIMVTHNPEIAEKYSNRIVKLLDGEIIDDSNPYDSKDDKKLIANEKTTKEKKTRMKFTTALHLSFTNLLTKKGRTILTSFAGSIGIIGIALILSLSSGVQDYIDDLQKDTMVSYPISIEAETIDVSSLLGMAIEANAEEVEHEADAVYSNVTSIEMASEFTTQTVKNNLTDFKAYLESEDCELINYVGDNGIVYSYDTKFNVYTYDSENVLVNTDGSSFKTNSSQSNGMISISVSSVGSDSFSQILSNTTDGLVSEAIKSNYELVYGEYPTAYNEVVLVLDSNNEISATTLYNLGLLPASEYEDILERIENDEEITLASQKIEYEDILNQTFYLVPACDYYILNSNGLYEYIGDDENGVADLVENGIELKITGIIKLSEDAGSSLIDSTIGYTKALTDYLIEYTKNSQVVIAQEASPDKNVINGLSFEVLSDDEKIADAKTYLSNLGISDKASFCKTILTQVYGTDTTYLAAISLMSEEELASQLDTYLESSSDTSALINIYDNYINAGSYEDNMSDFGNVDLDSPSSINIYANSFEDKELITDCIEAYNDTVSEESQITYTDYVALLMSSVTSMVNMVSYVLIAFVSISLIVSSIMIAIITYISVLERVKEIGILRAMGTSKKDISKIFNAETFIEGLVAGVLGVGVAIAITIPINSIIYNIVGVANIAKLPFVGGVALILISVALTVFAGIIPSKMAAKKDPAVVLRTE